MYKVKAVHSGDNGLSTAEYTYGVFESLEDAVKRAEGLGSPAAYKAGWFWNVWIEKDGQTVRSIR